MHKLQIISAPSLARHSHDEAYAAVVLSGSYEEAGDQGRFRVTAGDVVLHDRFEAHLDRFFASRPVLLNLPLAAGCCFTPGVRSVPDADALVRAAEKDPAQAVRLLLATAEFRKPACADWPDALAAALLKDPCVSLGRWGDKIGIAPWTLSRGFSQVFGVTAEAFRARSRARRAWKAVQATRQPLAEIAAELGFCDQPHMTRSVRQVTGRAPRAWRERCN